jgi:uncharacterized MAPEG superfamily protein
VSCIVYCVSFAVVRSVTSQCLVKSAQSKNANDSQNSAPRSMCKVMRSMAARGIRNQADFKGQEKLPRSRFISGVC